MRPRRASGSARRASAAGGRWSGDRATSGPGRSAAIAGPADRGAGAAVLGLMAETPDGTVEELRVALAAITFACGGGGLKPGDHPKLSTFSTISIGIGGMIGGGIFAVTGRRRGGRPDRLRDRRHRGAAHQLLLSQAHSRLVVVVSGHLDFAEVARNPDTALSVAGRAIMGKAGYVAVAVAALLATTSTIKATYCSTGRAWRTACRRPRRSRPPR